VRPADLPPGLQPAARTEAPARVQRVTVAPRPTAPPQRGPVKVAQSRPPPPQADDDKQQDGGGGVFSSGVWGLSDVGFDWFDW
jgi:hypothetical protein